MMDEHQSASLKEDIDVVGRYTSLEIIHFHLEL